MENTGTSKVLVTGPVLECLRVLKILHSCYGDTKQQENLRIDNFVSNIVENPTLEVNECLFPDTFTVQNKYFSAGFEVVVQSPPPAEDTLLEKFDGLITIVAADQTKSAAAWTLSGPLEPLLLRVTLLARSSEKALPDTFMEDHFDSLTTYTETLSVFLGTSDVSSYEEYQERDADGIGRLLEAVSEVMW